MYFAELAPVEHALMLLEHGADFEMGDFQVRPTVCTYTICIICTVYTYIYLSIYTCVYAYIYILYIYICVCVCVCACVCVCVCRLSSQ